ncbi:hypothetical protein [Bifidobacterium longum]|uniref:hypothetical protein n=1 Tax=Bifidobacterium longum TaxID=216816 RepID=UPI001E534826|nr:hypothetical protein [Bifidobacterium longum]MEE4091142.1 hypothetical protein [Bifidobacterium longum subsp. infantis]
MVESTQRKSHYRACQADSGIDGNTDGAFLRRMRDLDTWRKRAIAIIGFVADA